MAAPLLLKRYANRRLYDTEQSAHLTLADVAAVIRTGRPVKVVDAANDEDVTAFVLTGILLEEARRKNALLPAPLLHLLIGLGDNVLVDFFQNQLFGIIQAYLGQKAVFDDGIKRWVQMGLEAGGQAAKTVTALKGLNPFIDLFGGTPKK
jgi:polyhydroxyalkanoate synthesis repressor PhaR